MLDFIELLFNPNAFEPHGSHFVDHPYLFWFTILSNVVIALAYYSIPLTLAYFVYKRRDIPFNWMFFMFSAFILLCGTHHIVHIFTFWWGIYPLAGLIDFLTGVVSIVTAGMLWYIYPLALKIPSVGEFKSKNEKLQKEISKRKLAEAEVTKLNRDLESRVKARTYDLEQANKELKLVEKRKDDFISMASHELKTPITSMRGYAYALDKKLSNQKIDGLTIHLVHKIEDQITKQTQLVADLLDATRMQRGNLRIEKKPFDLNILVRDIVSDMQATTEQHNLVIEGNVSGEVYGDSSRIGQVLMNLLSNAIKFSPESEPIQIKIREDAQEAVVEVEDFGPGIGQAHLKRVFDRFYRVSGKEEATYPGLGVGLYISSQIVKLNGGKIWVSSEEGKGSTFGFSLPLLKTN